MNKAQKRIAAKLKPLVRKLTSRVGEIVIPTEETSEVKANRPEDYKTYLKLRREFNDEWKKTLVKLAKDGPVKMDRLLAYLDRHNINHTIARGFTGYVDAERKWWVKKKGKLVRINGVPSGFMFPTVRMNPNYPDSPWVLQAIKADGVKGNYFYTECFKKERRTEKFGSVNKLLTKIDKIRAKWMRMILHYDPLKKEYPAALILELLYMFSARIGSEGNGTEEGIATFGISTLRAKHCRIKGDTLTLSYRGKDGVKTKHTLRSKTLEECQIVTLLQMMKDKKKPSDPLFTYWTASGKFKPVRSGVVNKLFKELGAPCSVHKLRTYHATKMAVELIEDLKDKRKRFNSEKAAKEAMTKIAEKVGKKLNHVRRTQEGGQKVTGTTALANYISIEAQVDFYTHYNVALPKTLQKLI